VNIVQSNHWKTLKGKTQNLDRVDQENLLEFLEDRLPSSNVAVSAVRTRGKNNNDKLYESKAQGDVESDSTRTPTTTDIDNEDHDPLEEDYELLQCDLDKANIKLEELQSKRDFLQTRLQTYRSKIGAAEEFICNNVEIYDGEEIYKTRLVAMKEKIESYKTSLQPIQKIYQRIESELLSQRLQIESIQDRQLELKIKTQECRVVLHELSCNASSAETKIMPDDFESHEQLEFIENVRNVEDRSSNEGEQYSSNNCDVENDGVRRGKEEEREYNETLRKNTAEESHNALVIPIGAHLEIEPRREE